jgi:hypothetical protein
MTEQTLKIASLCIDCQTEYCELSQALIRTPKSQIPSSVSIQNEHGRFRIWARDAGAMRTGKHSLEYKLHDVSFLSQSIVMLLQDLNETLIEGLIHLLWFD